MEKLVKIQISGISPLICNKFTDAAAAAATSSTRQSIKTEILPREEAESRLYIQDRVVGIPGPNIIASITAAGKFHKIGKSKVTTMKTSLIPSCVWIEDTFIPIKPAKWEVDIRAIVNPSTSGRMNRTRPRFDAWNLKFSLRVDVGMMDVKLLRQIVDDAGKCIGLGDFRPERKGPFGRYVVIKWDVCN